MKKSLVALAVLAASGAAMAQSSVTLYGVADVSVAKATGGKFALSANGLLNNGNSRWGLRGTEDLGGGLKASFNYEAAVNLGTGAADANYFQRNAWLAVSGDFGEVKAGRGLSPHFFAIANYELTGTANYTALGNLFGFGGETRNNSFIAYTTPKMGGFKATVGTRLSGNNGTLGAKYELNATYNAGPLAVGFGYDKTGSANNKSIGAAYDLGQFVVAASFQDPNGAKKGFTIGGTARLGTNSVTLDIARDTGSAVKSTDYVFEAKEPLSKRTFLYQAIHRDGSAKVTTFGAGIRHHF